jgi:hypothetical protein
MRPNDSNSIYRAAASAFSVEHFSSLICTHARPETALSTLLYLTGTMIFQGISPAKNYAFSRQQRRWEE